VGNDGEFPGHVEELEHLRDVAVVGPAGRHPWHVCLVWDIARGLWTVRSDAIEDAADELRVGLHPLAGARALRPGVHAAEKEPEI
jgi:hypothetical protein